RKAGKSSPQRIRRSHKGTQGNPTRGSADCVLVLGRAQYPGDAVGSAAAGFVEVADLEFAEQAETDELNAGDDEHRGKDHEWAVQLVGLGLLGELQVRHFRSEA